AAPVVGDRALWWVSYGYLEGDGFPQARAVESQGRPLRYLRAALVGTVNAATGETRLYLAPGADSLAAAWAAVLTPLIQPLDSLPAALRNQLPFPDRVFRAATTLVRRWRSDTTTWTARPRDPFELVAPAAERRGGGVGGGDAAGSRPRAAQRLQGCGTLAAPGAADTTLAARWQLARRLAAQADAALAAGDLETFGRVYGQLKDLLGVGRRKLAPAPERR